MDLLKVVIEEAIEYWVGACGGDADEMEEQVNGHHVIRVLKHVHQFSHETEQAETIWYQEKIIVNCKRTVKCHHVLCIFQHITYSGSTTEQAERRC